MRLLSVKTFVLHDIPSHDAPQYAILSHTWGREEVSLKDLEDGSWESREDKREGRNKIRGACAIAAAEGFEYIWIDTCCINKWSSSELSEAINSMFRWYTESAICYAYLADVNDTEGLEDDLSQFSQTRWFTRGWTLQELLAPAEVVFFDQDWQEIGSKATLRPLIEDITRISGDALASRNWMRFSVAQKMSWAADRQTTRPEDGAYCLLGLFDINMPLLYGEGDRAFSRLQEEIIKRFDDESIFAWSYPADEEAHANVSGILAPSPSFFRDAGAVTLESSRREENMEMGKDTTDEYFLNTFELVRQLVHLRMPVLGPLRGIEPVSAGSETHVKQLNNVSFNVGNIRPKERPWSGVASEKKADPSTKADYEPNNPKEDDSKVPRLMLTSPEGEGAQLPNDVPASGNNEDSSEMDSLPTMSSDIEEDPNALTSWRWFIYDPMMIVPLLCSQGGQHLGIILAVSPKEGRALYRVHYPSLLMKENMISIFARFRQIRTLYVNGVLQPESPVSVLDDQKDRREVRIAQLLGLGYAMRQETSANWEYSKATGILKLRKHEREQSHLIIFEHRTDTDSLSFYVELGFERPVVGVFDGALFPRVAHSITEMPRKDSRIGVPMLETGKSIVFKWRHTKEGQLLNVSIEESRSKFNDQSLRPTPGGKFNMRLGLMMRNGLAASGGAR